MHVVAIKEQAAARMSSPTRTTFLGDGASADADEMLCSRPESEVEVRAREKLMGSLQLMADLMTRHPSLAQVSAPAHTHTHTHTHAYMPGRWRE